MQCAHCCARVEHDGVCLSISSVPVARLLCAGHPGFVEPQTGRYSCCDGGIESRGCVCVACGVDIGNVQARLHKHKADIVRACFVAVPIAVLDDIRARVRASDVDARVVASAYTNEDAVMLASELHSVSLGGVAAQVHLRDAAHFYRYVKDVPRAAQLSERVTVAQQYHRDRALDLPRPPGELPFYDIYADIDDRGLDSETPLAEPFAIVQLVAAAHQRMQPCP